MGGRTLRSPKAQLSDGEFPAASGPGCCLDAFAPLCLGEAEQCIFIFQGASENCKCTVRVSKSCGVFM